MSCKGRNGHRAIRAVKAVRAVSAVRPVAVDIHTHERQTDRQTDIQYTYIH